MKIAIQIRYNKVFAYILMIGLIGLFIAINFIDVQDKRGIIFGNILIGLLVAYFFFNFFLPMINGQIALELNTLGIYDFVRKQNVTWNNVREIRKVNFGRGSFGLGILLVDPKKFINDKRFLKRLMCKYNNLFYNTPFLIPLQFLAGSNKEIIESVQNYYNQTKLETNKSTATSMAAN